MKIFGYEPVVLLHTLSAVLGLVVSLGLTGLSPEAAAAIVGFATALLGAAAAWMTRPIAPAAFTAVVSAGAVLVAAFGYDVSQATIGAINAAVLSALTLVVRGSVSPTLRPSGTAV
ncbi:hypothetical protein [Streptomyces tsukubensis]|uniref:Uncharacterized protein n=1 Tax=Streptomyces tsukubensis TaxID=83656 RepID=A0A1V4ACR1_9ACTN|nr:hypothetical protein [Streptomyces tsukubensis]OON81707.1 hypothetical protein B1H18_06070 [Streptomyces tsukubensis]QFR96485.1 hypothetical protein GBW32_29910 [Streptomyces tsukubensis]